MGERSRFSERRRVSGKGRISRKVGWSEKPNQVASAQYLAGRNEVAGYADQKVGHVTMRRENARDTIEDRGRADRQADGPLYHPLAAKLVAPAAIVGC